MGHFLCCDLNLVADTNRNLYNQSDEFKTNSGSYSYNVMLSCGTPY